MTAQKWTVEDRGHYLSVLPKELAAMVRAGDISQNAIVWIDDRQYTVAQALGTCNDARRSRRVDPEPNEPDYDDADFDGYDRDGGNFDRGEDSGGSWLQNIPLKTKIIAAIPIALIVLFAVLVLFFDVKRTISGPDSSSRSRVSSSSASRKSSSPSSRKSSKETAVNETSSGDALDDVFSTDSDDRAASDMRDESSASLPDPSVPSRPQTSERGGGVNAYDGDDSEYRIVQEPSPIPGTVIYRRERIPQGPSSLDDFGSPDDFGAPGNGLERPPFQQTPDEEVFVRRDKPNVGYSLEPFDPSVTKIDPLYRGHDLGAVVAALRNGSFSMPDPSLAKSQKDYRRRLDALAESVKDEPLFGTTKFGSRLACVIPNRYDDAGRFRDRQNYDSVRTNYNAANKSLQIMHDGNKRYPYGWDRGGIAFPELAFPVYQEAPPMTNFAGRFNVTSYSPTYALGIEISRSYQGDAYPTCMWTIVGVEPEVYRQIERSLRVLCVFSLGAGGNGNLGLFTDLSSRDSDFNELFATAVEFWIYDGKTGEIYAKFSALETRRGVKKGMGDTKPGSVAIGQKSEKKDDEDSDKGGTSASRGEKKGGAPEEQKTALESWNEIYASARLAPKDWTSRKADVTIPDDCETLCKAIELCPEGGVIRIGSDQKRPVKLGYVFNASDDYHGATIDKPLTIVGDPEKPENRAIEIPDDESVWIASRDVNFDGVEFQYARNTRTKAFRPEVSVVEAGFATFRNCAFVSSVSDTTTPHALVDGKYAQATFEKCRFFNSSKEGLRVTNGASAFAQYCSFGPNEVGVSAFDGGIATIEKCLFQNNRLGADASGGGGLKIANSFFTGNRKEWSVSAGSRSACDIEKSNLVETPVRKQ